MLQYCYRKIKNVLHELFFLTKENKYYKVEIVNDREAQVRVYSGDTLMKAGILISNPWGDFKAKLIYLTEEI